MMTTRRWALLFGICALLLAIAGTLVFWKTAQAEDHAGFVLDVIGTWYLEGPKPRKIAGGDKLPVGGAVKPKPADPEARLDVCLFNGKIQTFTTDGILPKRSEPSFNDKLLRAVSGHYHGGIVHAVSRGDDLHDAVLRVDDGQLDVTSLVDGLTAGSYLLKFAPAQESLSSDATATLSVDWQPGDTKPRDTATTVAWTLPPGLYHVQLLDKRTKRLTGSDALTLVSAAADYEARLKTFNEIKALTHTWDDDVRKVVGLDVERACLASLADPQPE